MWRSGPQIRKATLLKRQLDEALIMSLDKDNNGLDKLEFVVGMLTKLEILHWDDVEPFLAQVSLTPSQHPHGTPTLWVAPR